MAMYFVEYMNEKGYCNMCNGGYNFSINRDVIEANNREEAITKLKNEAGKEAYKILTCDIKENLDYSDREEMDNILKYKPIREARAKMAKLPGFDLYKKWHTANWEIEWRERKKKEYEDMIKTYRAQISEYEERKNLLAKEYEAMTQRNIEDFAREYEAIGKDSE